MAESIVGQRIYIGGIEATPRLGNYLVAFNPTASVGPTPPEPTYTWRNDVYSGSLVFATPGAQFDDLSMTYAWSDISADIKGTGSNKSVLTTSIEADNTYNYWSAEDYATATKISGSGAIRASDDTDFEFGSGDFTIELYYNPGTDTTPTTTFFSDFLLFTPAQIQLWFRVENGELQVVYNDAGGQTFKTTSGLSWTSGQWYHLAISRVGANWWLLRDGASLVTWSDSTTLNTTSQPKYLMRYYNSTAFADSWIQDYRIYKGVGKYDGAYTPPESMIIEEPANALVTDTSVLLLDATNTASYPGSGNTWTDLSGNGNDADVSLITSYWNAGGYFDWPGTDYTKIATVTHASSLNIFDGDFSVLLVGTLDASATGFSDNAGAFGKSQWLDNPGMGMLVNRATGDSNARGCSILINNSSAGFSSNRKLFINYGDFFVLHFVRSGSDVTYYNNNGAFYVGSNSNNGNNSSNLILGRARNDASANYKWDGKIAAFGLYDKALTSDEVQQNIYYFKNKLGF